MRRGCGAEPMPTRKSWAVCPAKSLPARAIEESILGKLKGAQRGGFDLGEWWRQTGTAGAI